MPSSPAPPTVLSAAGIDFSGRVVRSGTVAASPTDNTETVVCTITIPQFVQVNYGVLLIGWGATTQGTNGTGYTLKLRQTGTSGTTIKSTGIIPLAAGVLGSNTVVGFDTSPSLPGQVYVLTALHTAASAASTYSAAELQAIVI